MSAEKPSLEALRINRDLPPERRGLGALVVLVLILLLLGGAAWWWWQRPKATVVETLVVHQGSAKGANTVLNASGYVTPRREATVSSKVTGKVMEVLVEEGMQVKAGQVLARLDDTNLRANLELTQAQLDAARSGLEETQVRLEEAQRELQRVAELADNKIATPSDLDRAQAEVKSLQARLNRQKVEVTVAERQVALWNQQMDDTIIRAPFAGVVVTKNAQPGEMISPVSAGGGFTRTGICTIVDMESLEVEVDVNESFINRVQAGQRVTATLDSYPDWKIPAKVIAIIPTADRQKATVRVRVGLEERDARVLPQMGVKVAFQPGKDSGASAAGMRIPRAAVRKDGSRDVVYVVQNGKVERRAVTLGATMADEVTVSAGLNDGEKIAVSGVERLTDGQTIKEAR
jgi:RND family efflux transporter MFP subunit